jgi:hypothetical protein
MEWVGGLIRENRSNRHRLGIRGDSIRQCGKRGERPTRKRAVCQVDCGSHCTSGGGMQHRLAAATAPVGRRPVEPSRTARTDPAAHSPCPGRRQKRLNAWNGRRSRARWPTSGNRRGTPTRNEKLKTSSDRLRFDATRAGCYAEPWRGGNSNQRRNRAL